MTRKIPTYKDQNKTSYLVGHSFNFVWSSVYFYTVTSNVWLAIMEIAWKMASGQWPAVSLNLDIYMYFTYMYMLIMQCHISNCLPNMLANVQAKINAQKRMPTISSLKMKAKDKDR